MTSKWIQTYFHPSPVEGQRNNNFNFLRFSAALMVLYGHMAHVIGAPVPMAFFSAVSTVAVEILFLISGYLITKSWQNDSNLLRYAARRCFRIFPALIGVVLFCAFLVGPLLTELEIGEYFRHPTTYGYLRNILLAPQYNLPGVFTENIYPNAVNGSLWTMPAEFTMYIVIPLLFLAAGRNRKRLKPAVGIATLLMIAAEFAHMTFFPTARVVIWASNPFDWFPVLPYYFVGACFAVFDWKKYLNLQWAAVLMTVLIFLPGDTFTGNARFLQSLLILAVFSYAVFSFAFQPCPVFVNWFAKNDYSYGMYLYGFVVQQIFARFAGARFGLNLSAFICIVGTFFCAFLSWHLIEKPCQKLCKHICNLSREREKRRNTTTG